jgi:hypothetical protein
MTLELTPVEVLPRDEAIQPQLHDQFIVGFLIMSNDLLEAVIISNSGESRSPQQKASSILKAVAAVLRHQSMSPEFETSPLRAASWMVAQYIESQAFIKENEHNK